MLVDIDGEESGVQTFVGAGQGKNNPTNPSTGLPLRLREFSFAHPTYFDGMFGPYVHIMQGGTVLCGAGIDANGTPFLFRGNVGNVIASGAFGSVAPGKYYDLVLNGFLDSAAGSLQLQIDGLVAVTFAGQTVPGVETYMDRRELHFTGGSGIGPTQNAPYVRKMPDLRGGSWAIWGGGGGRPAWDDLVLGAPSLLLQGPQFGHPAPVAGNVILGTTSLSTFIVSDYDDSSTFQALTGGTARIWGYGFTGPGFIDGENVSSGGFSGNARVLASSTAEGLEAGSDPLGNMYVFPMLSTADSSTTLTDVGVLASWEVAKQIPPNSANYLENSTAGALDDLWLAATDTLHTDEVVGVQMYADCRQTDPTIPNAILHWKDATGMNDSTPQPMPTSYGLVSGQAWAYQNDGTAIPPGTLSVATGVELAP